MATERISKLQKDILYLIPLFQIGIKGSIKTINKSLLKQVGKEDKSYLNDKKQLEVIKMGKNWINNLMPKGGFLIWLLQKQFGHKNNTHFRKSVYRTIKLLEKRNYIKVKRLNSNIINIELTNKGSKLTSQSSPHLASDE